MVCSKFKSRWKLIVPWALVAVLLVALVFTASAARRTLYVNIVGTYGGNAPGTPSITFDSTGHYAFSQDGSILFEGSYTSDGRTITMDDDGQTCYAIYIDDTIYFIQNGQAPLLFLRTSRTAVYPNPPKTG